MPRGIRAVVSHRVGERPNPLLSEHSHNTKVLSSMPAAPVGYQSSQTHRIGKLQAQRRLRRLSQSPSAPEK